MTTDHRAGEPTVMGDASEGPHDTAPSAELGSASDEWHSSVADLPRYDPVVVGRIAARVQILRVDLLGAHFERTDDEPLPGELGELEPEIGISASWALSDDAELLGCAITFGTFFEEGELPYSITAGFRLLYSLTPGERPKEPELMQFVYWNAVFNAWPYWREYVSSTINRAHLPMFMVPVMPVPRGEIKE